MPGIAHFPGLRLCPRSSEENPMATVCVKNVPDDLYEAVRKGARANRRSIAAEFRTLLEETYPTKRELKAPRKQRIKRRH
jgi:hypothetical protein